MKPLHTSFWLVALSCFWAAGCTSKQVLPDSGPDIQEVYQRHMGGIKGESQFRDPEAEASGDEPNIAAPRTAVYRPVRNADVDLVDYTRGASNEIDQLFPVLPNPQIVMYVYPHLTAKGRPVPGYSTAFRMYDKEEYALPGEWIPDHPDALPRGVSHDPSLTASREEVQP